jgi:Aerobic-type carbon monoxide dehydrogenase, middle subunit CoxM/CutM homologs
MVNGYRPLSLKEALEIRSTQDVVPYAGGTDLMVEDRKGVSYLFLNQIPELKEIREEGQYIRIGAAVTFTEALESGLIPPLMKEALARIAAPAIRNAGTFGGNIGNGSAKADSVLICFAADAKLRLLSVDGERVIDINQFYKGRKELDLRSDELIAEVLLPKTGIDNYYYKKVGGRNALAISRVSFAGVINLDGDIIRHVAAAFGAVSGMVLRMRDLEQMLEGKTLAQAKELKPRLLELYAERMELTRGRVSAEYRKAVCMNLLNDFLSEKGI